MLKTMRAALNAHRSDCAIEQLILDAGDNAETRDLMLESMGEPEPIEDEGEDKGDSEDIDPEFEKLIADIPETDIDEDFDGYMEGKVVAKDELGDKKEMSLDEVAEQLIPDTEEE